MTREQRQYSTGPEAILDISRWQGSNWWGHPKRQTYSFTKYTTKWGTRTNSYQSYGNRQNKIFPAQLICF